MIAEAICALDRVLGESADPTLVAAAGAVATALADRVTVGRMVLRLGELRAVPAEREAFVRALGALIAVAGGLLLDAYVAAAVTEREPYRAVMRHAGDRALEALADRVGEGDPLVVAAAAALLGASASPKAVELLVPLMRHPSPAVRETVATALAEIGGPEISRPLIPALKDESLGVRLAAAHAIGVAGDPAAAGVLERRLDVEEAEMVLAALLRALGRIGARDSVSVLARYAEPGGMRLRRGVRVRVAALEALATVGGANAHALLALYSHDKEPDVRHAALAGTR